jgi:protein-tyrosine phosphatase
MTQLAILLLCVLLTVLFCTWPPQDYVIVTLPIFYPRVTISPITVTLSVLTMEKIKVLFVCMGNICRSPTAEGVFTKLVKDHNLGARFVIDSAGTHAYHVGNVPDLRAQAAALERGFDLSNLRARKVNQEDFETFDFLLAMDDENYSILIGDCPEQYRAKVKYFLDYAPHLNERQVPDPYYGGKYGFERVLDMVEEASVGLLKALRESGNIK